MTHKVENGVYQPNTRDPTINLNNIHRSRTKVEITYYLIVPQFIAERRLHSVLSKKEYEFSENKCMTKSFSKRSYTCSLFSL